MTRSIESEARRGRGAFHLPDDDAGARGSTGDVDYRAAFANNGNRILYDRNKDARRWMSWAPYLVVPAVAIATNFTPKQYRIKLWVSTLVFYGIVSVGMYNTDTRED